MPDADIKTVEKFINDVQALFPNNKVDINNVNDFSIVFEEKRNCVKCKGLEYCKNSQKGFYQDVNGDSFIYQACEYKKTEAQKRNTLIKTLYLPDSILDASLETFHTNSESRKKIYAEILKNMSQDTITKGLYLYGNFSKGKTYTLAVIANELAKKGLSSLLIYFPDLVLDLKNAIGTPRFEDLVNMLKDIDILMLDDLGSENITPWIRDEILGPVINYRLMDHKPLYISSNLNPEELIRHLSINGADELKATRISTRLAALAVNVNMDDSKTYKR